jgi:dipeptidyl-peptidase-4
MKPMPTLFRFLSIVFSFTCLTAQTLQLEDIWASSRFYAKGVDEIRWMQNDQQYSKLEEGPNGTSLILCEVRTGNKISTILEASRMVKPNSEDKIIVEDYQFSKNESCVLFLTERRPLYRHSGSYVCYYYHRNRQQLSVVMEGKPVYNPTLSPDGKYVAFIWENDLYIQEVNSTQITRVTVDGWKNKIINGMSDWVYEEEFTFTRAYEWSEDGKKIAYYKFDESDVPEYGMDIYGKLYPSRETFKYPKAGEKNSIVKIFIYDLNKRLSVASDIGEETDQYIPRIRWTQNSNQLMILRLNRLQNKLDFLLADANTGKTRQVLQEISDTYVEIHDHLYFLKDKKHFLWLSEKGGFNQLYLHSLVDSTEKKISQGEIDIVDICSIDEVNGWVYAVTAEPTPMDRSLIRYSLSGNYAYPMHRSSGNHQAIFSAASNYYIHSFSSDYTPPKIILRDRSGHEIKSLESNDTLRKEIQKIALGTKSYFTIPGGDGTLLNACKILPNDFDPSRKYPVLMFVYGGPGSQTVKNTWEGPNGLWYQLLASKGYIIVSVDNRGTGYRGNTFKKCTYRQLGKLEAEDQIAAAKWLSVQSWVDGERIGIWGWSFGGYVTALCVTKGEGIFHAGISVAPVTNWKYYDSVYTERFLQRPQDNTAGYENNSPVNYAKGLKGKYLLIHGSADDNVHLQNSIDFSDALIRANKDFQMFIYPNKNHSIGGRITRLHLYRQMTEFLKENL